MHAARLKKIGSSTGPFACVYFEEVRNREDARELLDLEWRALRGQLTHQGAPPPLLERLGEVKDNHHGISGRGGRAIVAAPEAVLLDDILFEPTPTTVATYGRLPYLVPLVTHGYDTEPFLLAKVDHLGADLCVRDARGVNLYSDIVSGTGYPVHKAHVGGQDRYADTQAAVEENRRKNLARAAERASELALEYHLELVVVVGEVQSRTAFRHLLPPRLRPIMIERGSRAAGSSPAEVSRAIGHMIDIARLRRMDTECERFGAGRADGLSVDGTARVLDALEQGNVDTLLLTEPDDIEVRTDSTTGPADRVLPLLAVRTGAELVRIDERLTLADGYGAILRHR